MTLRQTLLNPCWVLGCQKLSAPGWLANSTPILFHFACGVHHLLAWLESQGSSQFPSVMWSARRGEAAAAAGRGMWEKRRGSLLQDQDTKSPSVPHHLGSPGPLCENVRVDQAVRGPRRAREGSPYVAGSWWPGGSCVRPLVVFWAFSLPCRAPAQAQWPCGWASRWGLF